MHLTNDYKKEIYRKSIHLSSLWIPLMIYFAPTTVSAGILAILLIGNIILEYGNFSGWRWAKVMFKIFSPTLRKKELETQHLTFTGSVYVLSSALICALFFSKNIAVISLCIMLISDTAAALIGKAFGTNKIYQEKSLEGTLAFFLSSLLIMIICSPLHSFSFASIIACLCATAMELYEKTIKIDDNLSIPLSIGIILSLL